MDSSFKILVWDSFKKIGGLLVTSIALIATIILWSVDKSYMFYAYWVIPIITLLLIAGITFFDVALNAYDKTKNLLPKVLYSREMYGNSENGALCLLEPCSLLSQDSYVSFFLIDNQGFELFIGSGVVIMIQTDKKIQVFLDQVLPGHQQTLTEIIQNNGATIEKLIVKPGMPKHII